MISSQKRLPGTVYFEFEDDAYGKSSKIFKKIVKLQMSDDPTKSEVISLENSARGFCLISSVYDNCKMHGLYLLSVRKFVSTFMKDFEDNVDILRGGSFHLSTASFSIIIKWIENDRSNMILNEGVSLTPAEYANWEILEAWIKLQTVNISVDFQLYYFKECEGEITTKPFYCARELTSTVHIQKHQRCIL